MPRVKSIAHARHQCDLHIAEKEGHQAVLLHPHTVFAGDNTAHGHTVLDDSIGGGDGALAVAGLARVEEDDGMQVPVPRMKDIANFKTVLAPDFRDAPQSLGKFRSRDNTVLHIVRRRKASHRAKCVLPPFP